MNMSRCGLLGIVNVHWVVGVVPAERGGNSVRANGTEQIMDCARRFNSTGEVWRTVPLA